MCKMNEGKKTESKKGRENFVVKEIKGGRLREGKVARKVWEKI